MNKPNQQQVIDAYKRLPPPVREFLADPDQLARVLADIRTTHDLHIDVAGQIGESVGYLLLGLASPGEFRDMLKTTGVSEVTANDIIGEINQKIFVPLRDEMRKGGKVEETAKPAAPEAPREGVLQPRTTIIPANPTLPPKAPQTLTPTSNYAPKPPPTRSINLITGTEEQRSALRDALNAVTIGPTPTSPKATQGTATTANRMLEDHEEPRIEFKKTSPPSRPLPPNPFGAFSVKRPPTNLPDALPPQPIPPPPTSPKATQGTAPAPAKPYSSDPYREPLE